MKEKDLEKCLNNLVIKGLIQEAEQDNAEFEVAMREMSDEDFLALIYDTVEDHSRAAISLEKDIVLANKKSVEMSSNIAFGMSGVFEDNAADEWDDFDLPEATSVPKKSEMPQKGWKVWVAALASVAAVLLIVFIPAYREMDARLCGSALLVSEAYMPTSRGTDISSMKNDEVEAMLPKLEKQYSISVRQEKRTEGIAGEQAIEKDDLSYYIERVAPRDAGMELVQAYLKLNQKDKAIEILRELAESDEDPDFREYCRKMLEILE
ncbi:MAG: hypothetical protein K2N35_04950 [Muribaculaceae bacterium]|nr:hypothetical protein [Muribaculaceae bacterium]